jgi:hypothetical protein
LKLALVDPSGTVTEAGVVSRTLLSDKKTNEPPLGAALLRLIAQLAVALDPSVEGVHPMDETLTGATRFKLALREMPFSVAVTVAVWSVVTAAVLTVKLAAKKPVGTSSEVGVTKIGLLSLRETIRPPAVAAALRLTVHFAIALDPRLEGLQTIDETAAEAIRLMVAPRETPFSVAVTVAV